LTVCALFLSTDASKTTYGPNLVRRVAGMRRGRVPVAMQRATFTSSPLNLREVY